MADWKKVFGSQKNKPSSLDTSTSKSYVYQRRNIERVTHTDDDGNEIELWEYEERKLTREEYALIHVAELEDELIQTQLAITELYEGLL